MYKATYEIQEVKPSKPLYKGDRELCYKPLSERKVLEKEYLSLEILKEKMQVELNQFLSLHFSDTVTIAIELTIEENGEYCDSEELFCVFTDGKVKLKDVAGDKLENLSFFDLHYGLYSLVKSDDLPRKEKEHIMNELLASLECLINEYFGIQNFDYEKAKKAERNSYLDILLVFSKKIEKEKLPKRAKEKFLDILYSLEQALWRYSY